MIETYVPRQCLKCKQPFEGREAATRGYDYFCGDCWAAIEARRRERPLTICAHGHAMTDDNTYVQPDGKRECRTCRRLRRHRRAALTEAGEA